MSLHSLVHPDNQSGNTLSGSNHAIQKLLPFIRPIMDRNSGLIDEAAENCKDPVKNMYNISAFLEIACNELERDRNDILMTIGGPELSSGEFRVHVLDTLSSISVPDPANKKSLETKQKNDGEGNRDITTNIRVGK